MRAKLIIEKKSLNLALLACKVRAPLLELGNSLFVKHTLYWLKNAKKRLAE